MAKSGGSGWGGKGRSRGSSAKSRRNKYSSKKSSSKKKGNEFMDLNDFKNVTLDFV